MRLIDADALKAMFPENYDKPLWHFTGIWAAIGVQPTIDAAPVRRGEWVAVGDDDQDVGIFFCSLCKDERWFGEEVYTSAEAARLCPYCPNCGADMRKEEHAHDD